MPQVSVVVPAYESEDTLSRAIDSVLSQTLDDIEIIVVDDGSTDDIESLVTGYDDPRVRFASHATNRGGSQARNTGVELAEGDYVAFLDDDDEFRPEKLEKQVEVLKSRSDDWVAVHCNRTFERSLQSRIGYHLARLTGARKANPRKEGGTELIKEVLLGNLSTGSSTLLVDAPTVKAMGGFDSDFPRHQDWEFLIRVLKHGKLAYVDEPLVMKHGTERPGAETYVDAKEMLLSTFSEDVARLEAKGYPVTHLQNLYLAKMFLEDGHFFEGLRRLETSELQGIEYLSVGWSLARGVGSKLL